MNRILNVMVVFFYMSGRPMWKRYLYGLLFIFAVNPSYAVLNGAVVINGEQGFLAWSDEQKKWVDIEFFWRDYIRQKTTRHWPRARHYPDYHRVKEHDTFIIELDQGICLMEFFHSRWRRANDVWRWDNAMNQYSGCPYVFD